MRAALLTVVLVTISPSVVAGAPISGFANSWKSLPVSGFTHSGLEPSTATIGTHPSPVSDASVSEALSSAGNVIERRDIAINEIAAGWEPARRAALEDLRDAQRAYAGAAGGNDEVRGRRFVALIKQVADGSGRSSAHDPAPGDDKETLNSVYDRVLRNAPDSRLEALESIERSWTVYRDAFDRFALIMDRPDAALAIDHDLTRLRAEELKSEASQ